MHSWKQISKPAARLGGQSELGAAVSTKTVWWGMRLASLLTHLFYHIFALTATNCMKCSRNIGGVACCEYGINVCDSFPIHC